MHPADLKQAHRHPAQQLDAESTYSYLERPAFETSLHDRITIQDTSTRASKTGLQDMNAYYRMI